MTETYKFITFTDTNFQNKVLDSLNLVLVEFCLPWHGSSQIMTPVIVEIAHEFIGKVVVGRIDLDKNPQVANTYCIRAIPTFLIFKTGVVVDQVIGLVRKIELRHKLNAQLKRNK